MSDLKFKQYRRTNIAEMAEYEEGMMLPYNVSISAADGRSGSPKIGDMIARNPNNHDDTWLVAKEYFEKNFAPVRELPNSLTPKRIESCIDSVEYQKMGQKTMVCVLTLVNGFEVIGISGCVNPENYDPEIGRRIARENAVEKIWGLEGYLLQQCRHEEGL